MVIVIENQEDCIFEYAVSLHTRRAKCVPTFYLGNEEMIELLIEKEIVNSRIDAITHLESKQSSIISIIQDGWYYIYHPFSELWVFDRLLDRQGMEKRREAELKVTKFNLKKRIEDLCPKEFEALLFDIFDRLDDYEGPIARPQTRDGGFEMDVRFTDPVTKTKERILIQAKHQLKPVPVSHTRELIGTLDVQRSKSRGRGKAIRGMMISICPPSVCSETAAELSSYRIDFLDVGDLVELMMEYNIGCNPLEGHSLSIIDDVYWDELMEARR